jgi:flagellar biosynthesis component FlhA
MKSGLRNAIWRSRAVAIIGLLIIVLALFSGLPGALRSTLFVVFGLLTLSFGIAGSRHKSYDDRSMAMAGQKQTEEEPLPTREEILEEEIIASPIVVEEVIMVDGNEVPEN